MTSSELSQATKSMSAGSIENLAQVRDSLASLGLAGDLLSNFFAGVDQVLGEHRGMADELLGVYEQLGLVFALTKKLAAAQGEEEVMRQFITTLRQSFLDREVLLAKRDQSTWRLEGTLEATPWLVEILNSAAAKRTVMVEQPHPGSLPPSIAEVMLGPIPAGESVECVVLLTRPPHANVFRAGDMRLIESLTRFCGDLIRNQRLVRELRGMSVAMVRSLVNAVDQKDEYTCGHSLRVAYYATTLAKRLKFNSSDLQMLQWSALLHDVGKIGIRDNVLKKEGKLTEEEFQHIKEHPVRSHRVVQEVPQLAKALDGILYHHERYDGRGYPEGLAGEAIPLQARIIQIADVFDALTSTRAYRPAYDVWQALEIMKQEAGKTIDPHLACTFDEMIREILSKGGDAWERLVHHANQFAREIDETQTMERCP